MRSLAAMILCAASILSAPVMAGGAVDGATVLMTAINRIYPNVVFIRLSATPTGLPACSVLNPTWAFTLSLDGVNGKELYALLLAATVSGKSVQASGTGTCNEHSQVETLQSLYIYG
jgi:hypothetical protein